MIQNRRILITGCAGSIGSELTRQLCKENEVYGLDNNETGFFDLYEELGYAGTSIKGRIGDIRDKDTVEEVVRDFDPHIIFHAAAYKHVTPLEKVPREAIDVNLLGLLNVLEAAKKYVTKKYVMEKFIFVSSDKAVNATSIMGVTKRLGELIVKNAGGISVRFGNVLGSRGSVIPIWQKQLDNKLPLTVTDPQMERFFMTIPQAVELLIQAAEIGNPGEILVLDMGKRVKVIDVAEEIISAFGKDGTIKIIGKRPGEILVERLMTEEEEKIAIKKDKIWVIK